MRLYEIRRGQVTDVELARPRLLRLSVAAPAAGARASVSDLRTFVVGDLIRRNAERRKLVIQAGQDAGGAADGAALGLRPAEEARLDGLIDVQVSGPDPGDQARHWTAPGPVRFSADHGRNGRPDRPASPTAAATTAARSTWTTSPGAAWTRWPCGWPSWSSPTATS